MKMVQSRNCWTEEYKEMQRSIFFFLEPQSWTDDTYPRRHTKPEEEEEQQQQQYEPYNSNNSSNRPNRRTKKKTNAQG
ncbi:hypothetical protein M514_21991, partial [Trichuris suis]